MSEVVLSGQTAMLVYRDVRLSNSQLQPATFHVDSRIPTLDEIQEIRDKYGANLKNIDILLKSNSQLRRSKEVEQKVFPFYRSGIVCSINTMDPWALRDNILVVSPAFLVALKAKHLEFINLLYLALELGGSFMTGNDGELLTARNSLLMPRQLNAMAKKLENVKWHGIKKLLAVNKHFASNAASPMEIELYMKMSLPPRLGGFGLDGVLMNKKIRLSNQGYKIANQLDVTVDFLHPASKVVVEYDSRNYHSSIDQSQKDKRRRDALQHDGYKCFSILPYHITDRDVFNACMKPIVTAIKGRCRIRAKHFDYMQRELFLKLGHCRGSML